MSTIDIVNESGLAGILSLLRDYCEFYNQTEQILLATDDALLTLCRALIANLTYKSIRLVARFATMNDLFLWWKIIEVNVLSIVRLLS